jgi:hypothetical protein
MRGPFRGVDHFALEGAMAFGTVPTLAASLFHWEDFSIEINQGILDPSWPTLLETRTEIEEKTSHLNDDQRLRLANADAIVRSGLMPLLRQSGACAAYDCLRDTLQRENWWYCLDK